MKRLFGFLLLILTLSSSAQFRPQGNSEWDADWVAVPGAGETTPGLYLFRKTISLESVPAKFEMRVSADNRYKLYVNETLVSLGPALGDIQHWNYETVDLAPYLKAGENIVAAKVWNEGDLKAVSQFSYRTGFLLQGTDEETKALNTDTTWKCIQDLSFTPLRQRVRGYYAAGAGEKIDMHYQVKGWEKLSFDDAAWEQTKPVFERNARGFRARGGAGPWCRPSFLRWS